MFSSIKLPEKFLQALFLKSIIIPDSIISCIENETRYNTNVHV